MYFRVCWWWKRLIRNVLKQLKWSSNLHRTGPIIYILSRVAGTNIATFDEWMPPYLAWTYHCNLTHFLRGFITFRNLFDILLVSPQPCLADGWQASFIRWRLVTRLIRSEVTAKRVLIGLVFGEMDCCES